MATKGRRAPARSNPSPVRFGRGFSHAGSSLGRLLQDMTCAMPNVALDACIRAWLQPCRMSITIFWALAPAMSRPVRNAHSSAVPAHRRTFFATTKTSMGRRLFQSEPNAGLFVDVLRSCLIEREFELHDFVIMPDHVHLLMTIGGKMTIEKAMQFIKGRFSYRMKRERGYLGEVWQGGFSEVRVEDRRSFSKRIEYIALNPVRAGLVNSSEEYPYCYRSLARAKAQGLKPEA